MGVTLERVQSKFACIIGELCNEPDILSQFAIWVDIRLAEYKTKGAISLDCTGCEPDPNWLRGHKGKQLGSDQGEITEREPWCTGSTGVNTGGLTTFVEDQMVQGDKEAEQYDYNGSANSLGEDMNEDVQVDRLADMDSRDVDNYQESDSVQSWRDEGFGRGNLTAETQCDRQEDIQSDVQLMKDGIDPRAELGEEEVVFPTHIYKIMPRKRTLSCRLIQPKSENHNQQHAVNSHIRDDLNSTNINFQQGRLSTPKVCDQCGQVYYRYDSFRRHRRTHLADKKHACVLCPKQFSRNEHLKRHMMSRHPDFFNMGTPLPNEQSDHQSTWND